MTRVDLRRSFSPASPRSVAPPQPPGSLPDAESPERLEFESGLGLALMRRLADETTIETSVDGTAVRLIIRFLTTGDET